MSSRRQAVKRMKPVPIKPIAPAPKQGPVKSTTVKRTPPPPRSRG